MYFAGMQCLLDHCRSYTNEHVLTYKRIKHTSYLLNLNTYIFMDFVFIYISLGTTKYNKLVVAIINNLL